MALSEEELNQLRVRVAFDPTNSELRLQLVHALIEAHRFHEALTSLGEMIGRRRNDRRVGRLLVELQLRWESLASDERRAAFRLERRAWAEDVRRRASRGRARRFGPVPLGSETRSGSFLLWGPPGCGKRSAVTAFATRSQAVLVSLDLPALVASTGEHALHLLEVAFEAAFEKRRVVVLLEGLEAIAPSAGYGNALGRDAWRMRRLLLGRLRLRGGVLVVVSTSQPWALDRAVLQMLDGRHFWPPPDFRSRVRVLERELEGRSGAHDLVETAKCTDGWSAGDLTDLCNRAKATVERRKVSRRALRNARLAAVPTAPAWFQTAIAHASADGLDGFYDDMLTYVDRRSSST